MNVWNEPDGLYFITKQVARCVVPRCKTAAFLLLRSSLRIPVRSGISGDSLLRNLLQLLCKMCDVDIHIDISIYIYIYVTFLLKRTSVICYRWDGLERCISRRLHLAELVLETVAAELLFP